MNELAQGNVKKIIAGTVVVNAQSTKTSLSVFTNTQLSQMLGVSSVGPHNTVCFFANGDGGAQSAHVDGATYYNNEWRAVLDRAAYDGSFRVNYVVVLY